MLQLSGVPFIGIFVHFKGQKKKYSDHFCWFCIYKKRTLFWMYISFKIYMLCVRYLDHPLENAKYTMYKLCFLYMKI